MLNIKCFYCGKSFALDEATVRVWLEEHKEEHPRHYPANCHFCRRVVKVPIKRLLRGLPEQ
jgi:hypothetical protein